MISKEFIDYLGLKTLNPKPNFSYKEVFKNNLKTGYFTIMECEGLKTKGVANIANKMFYVNEVNEHTLPDGRIFHALKLIPEEEMFEEKTKHNSTNKQKDPPDGWGGC
jgi:hypothetical protein